MADKNRPVWFDQGDGKTIQIGVASDPVDGVSAVEIWPEFKDYKITDYIIGDAEQPVLYPEPTDDQPPANPEAKSETVGDVLPDQNGEAAPAEGALAEPTNQQVPTSEQRAERRAQRDLPRP